MKVDNYLLMLYIYSYFNIYLYVDLLWMMVIMIIKVIKQWSIWETITDKRIPRKDAMRWWGGNPKSKGDTGSQRHFEILCYSIVLSLISFQHEDNVFQEVFAKKNMDLWYNSKYHSQSRTKNSCLMPDKAQPQKLQKLV